MTKSMKKIFAVVITTAVMFILAVCFGQNAKVTDNQFGGKSYNLPSNLTEGGGIINDKNIKHITSRPLPEQFPSDKIPTMDNCTVGGYSADFDRDENLIDAKLYMQTKRSSKEVYYEYKNFYKNKDLKLVKEKIDVDKYVEELTSYECRFEKDGYLYIVSASRAHYNDYSDVEISLRKQDR